MALRFILDENLRGPLWNLIARHNRKQVVLLDVVRVGDVDSVPLGIKDPELLRWAELEGRIVVSEDRRTTASHLIDHLHAGHHSPGVMTLKARIPSREVLEFLLLVAQVTEPEEWADANWFVP